MRRMREGGDGLGLRGDAPQKRVRGDARERFER